jgi:predicted permease
MFTVVDRVLLRGLPYAHASRLAELGEGSVDENTQYWFGTPYLDLSVWREQSKSFEEIAYYDNTDGRSFAGNGNAAAEIGFMRVSPNFFATLGVRPALGPGIANVPDGSAESADANTVVVSDNLWRNIFGADPKILGKTVQINGQPYVIAGVMPRDFSFPYGNSFPQAWAPLVLTVKDRVRTKDTQGYTTIARLRAGVTAAKAQAELSTIQKHVSEDYNPADSPFPDPHNTLTHVRVSRYADGLVQQPTRHALYALFSASLLLWLIACVNATNLMLVRALSRQREMAMRGALGASRRRLIQQFIVEACLLSISASALGAGLSLLMIRLFQHALKSTLPFSIAHGLNLPVLLGLVALTLLTAILSAAWPAWITASAPIEPALRQGGQQSGTSCSHHRLRGGLVIAEIAMSLTLLAACGLLLRTIYGLRHVPLGFRTDHIVVANLDIPTYRFSTINASANVYEPLLERVKNMPGIDAAGLMTQVPLGHTFRMQLTLYADDKDGSHPTVNSLFKAVTPDLQRVYAFRVLYGRNLNPQDTAASDPVVVVNRAFARAYDPKEQDLSKVIGAKVMSLSHGEKGRQATIIGILDDFHQSGIDRASSPEIEASMTQITPDSGYYTVLEGIAMDLAVRTQRPLPQVIPELREALRQASPELANSNITTMDQIVEDSYGSQMLAAHLLEIFAASALLLCVVGLYGLLAYVVSQRTREMGVRFALGAQRGDVIWLILRQAGVLVLTGVALGLALAFASTRFIRSYLFGVSAHDGWTLAAVAVVLIICGAVAAYLPARRAASVNPVEALRAE